MDVQRRITSLESVPTDTTFLFQVRPIESDGDESTATEDTVREAILVQLADGVAAWLNYCQHLTHIKLDKGDGAPMRNGEVVCANHGAYFEADSGRCTYGPCKGAYLNDVTVTVEDGDVYLTDESYEFVDVGPCSDNGDRTSTSNVEF